MNRTNTHKYIARIIMESITPMFVGSGESSLLKDALVQKDFQGLPMIPGTALAGVLRHSILDQYNKSDLKNYTQEQLNEYFSLLDLFGAQFNKKSKTEKELFENWYKKNRSHKSNIPDGLGSRLKISSAYFLLPNNEVAEDLFVKIDESLKMRLTNLPIRKHVKINDKGVANSNGLFDNEIVPKGAKFVFEVELSGSKEDHNIWEKIIEELKSPVFKVGQGTRKGYGRLKVEKIFNKTFHLEKDFESYLNFDPSFNSVLNFDNVENVSNNSYLTYKLSLEPDNFFIFSEGFGDNEVDNKPLVEEVIKYTPSEILFEEQTVIPASSIKGAISHRVAFHYNKSTGKYADTITDSPENYLGDNNEAVSILFGNKGDIGSKKKSGKRGIVVFDDLFYDDIDNSKIINHVAIDRFTGGAINGALFSEKVSYSNNKSIELSIYITNPSVDSLIQAALEESLKDICKGLLPLGGMSTKGHGMFTGELRKNHEVIFTYKNVNSHGINK